MKRSLPLISVFALILSGCSAVSNDYAGQQASQSWQKWQNKKLHFRTPKKSTPKVNEEKLNRFLTCIREFAPYILDEFASIDKKMKWSSGTAAKRCIFGIDYKKTPPPHECTSWIIMPELTSDHQLILHKNRDSSSRYLTAERVSVPGYYSWIGNCNFGYFGTTSGMNERAVAIAMNSGPRSTGVTPMGMGTTIIARILLEQSGSAQEALKLLEKIVRGKAYSHGSSGSIWFIADRKQAFVVEHDGLFFKAAEVKSGLAIRANAWHYPEMIVHSKNTPSQIVGNARREYAVRNLLVNNILARKKLITLPDVFKASRIDRFPEAPKCYPLCGSATVAGSSFVIDKEFPEELSYLASTFGPPRHGLYVPVPLTLKQFPIEFRNGSWSEQLFKLKKAKKRLDMKKLEIVEDRMLKNHLAAVKEARKILRAGGCGAGEKAARLLENAFRENLKTAQDSADNDWRCISHPLQHPARS